MTPLNGKSRKGWKDIYVTGSSAKGSYRRRTHVSRAVGREESGMVPSTDAKGARGSNEPSRLSLYEILYLKQNVYADISKIVGI